MRITARMRLLHQYNTSAVCNVKDFEKEGQHQSANHGCSGFGPEQSNQGLQPPLGAPVCCRWSHLQPATADALLL